MKGTMRVEVPPLDEVSSGIPAAPQPPPPPLPAVPETEGARGPDGRLRDPEFARALGLKSALARQRKKEMEAGIPALLKGLGLSSVPEKMSLEYYKMAIEFAESYVRELAMTVGGGYCGPGPSSLVQTAGLQLAASRLAFMAGDMITGSRLGNDSRQNIIGAQDLCGKEALARDKAHQMSPHAALTEALRDGAE